MSDVFFPHIDGGIYVGAFAENKLNEKVAEYDGFLGSLVQGTTLGPEGGRYRSFTNGGVYYHPDIGAHVILGSHFFKYQSVGGPSSFIGYPTADTAIVSFATTCQYGVLFGSETVCILQGEICQRWIALGGSASFLGYAVTDETTTPDGIGRYNHFQNGSIYWSPASGAWEIFGAARDKWASMGWENSFLGYPTGAPQNKQVFSFEGGTIHNDNGAIHVLSSSIIIETGEIWADVTKCTARLVLNSDGGWNYSGRFRTDGISGVECAVSSAPVFQAPDGSVFVVSAEGRVGGTLSAADRAMTFDKSGRDDRLRQNWRAMRGSSIKTVFKTDVSVLDVVEVVVTAIPIVVGIIVVALVLSGNVKACPPKGVRRTNPDGSTSDEVQIEVQDKNMPCY